MQAQRQYRYFEFVMVAFVVVLVCSNLIGPAKAAQIELPLIGAVTFGAGVLFFPISYVFGDILTEVYGYSRARRVIWAGFAALMFAAVMASEENPVERRKAISAAKVQIGRSARHVGQEAIQLHGGIGMTNEYAVGHYFKRVTMIDQLYGDADTHLSYLAAHGGLFGKVA